MNSINNNADPANVNADAASIILRRHIAHLEEENNRLRQAGKKYVFAFGRLLSLYDISCSQQARSNSHRLAGRTIRRLVSLTNKIESIVDKHDRRLLEPTSRATAEYVFGLGIEH